jgi:hypothetical protein
MIAPRGGEGDIVARFFSVVKAQAVVLTGKVRASSSSFETADGRVTLRPDSPGRFSDVGRKRQVNPTIEDGRQT